MTFPLVARSDFPLRVPRTWQGQSSRVARPGTVSSAVCVCPPHLGNVWPSAWAHRVPSCPQTIFLFGFKIREEALHVSQTCQLQQYQQTAKGKPLGLRHTQHDPQRGKLLPQPLDPQTVSAQHPQPAAATNIISIQSLLAHILLGCTTSVFVSCSFYIFNPTLPLGFL